jgi:protein ImuA
MGQSARQNDIDLAQLRERISVLEQQAVVKSSPNAGETISLGLPALDSALPQGGLKLAGLHEVIALSPGFLGFTGISGASSGFAAWLLKKCLGHSPGIALWCRRPAGRFDPQPYGPGLAQWLDPTRLLLIEARQQTDVLWAMEEGLRCKGVAAVLGETGSVDLTATRRLLLAAEGGGSMAILLRPAGTATSSAALSRWRISAAAAQSTSTLSTGSLRDIARPRWQVELSRARGLITGDQATCWLMEWNDETGDLALASSPLDRSSGATRPAMAREAGGDGGFGFRRAAARFG